LLLSFARVAVGLAMAAHGTQKLFGWFGGHGLDGTGGYLSGLGYRPGRAFALGLGLAEFGSGALTALGLLGPVGPALMISVMIAAALVAHRGNGFFAMTNGFEMPFLYAAAALVFLAIGPSALSLDALLRLERLWAPEVVWVALAVGVVGGVVGAALRRPAAAKRSETAAAA
jgi:putative oxidoreductase